jgi:hypothetical protein
MRERIPHPDDRPDEDRDELPEPNPAAGIAERPSTDALEEPPPEQVETEQTNARTTEDF